MMTSATSDHEDIKSTLLRFTSGIDRRNWDLLRSAFTDDCHVEMGEYGVFDGVEEIAAYESAAHADVGLSVHRMTNYDIATDGDRGTARTYVDVWVMLTTAAGGPGAHAIGIYDDELVRTSQGWRIAKRSYTSVRFEFAES